MSLLNTGERDYTCCGGNANTAKLLLPQIAKPTPGLRDLIETEPKKLRKHAVAINQALAMTSRTANEKRFGPGIPAYSVQGCVYRQVNSLLPSSSDKHDDKTGAFLQLYFYDHSENDADRRAGDLTHRMSRSTQTGTGKTFAALVGILATDFELHNLLLQLYQPARRTAEAGTALNMKMILHDPSKPVFLHRGRLHHPIAKNEIGAVYEEIDGALNPNAAVVVGREGNRTFIRYDHPLFLPLGYPLLVPTGQQQYHRNLYVQTTKRAKGGEFKKQRITARKHNNFMIYQRESIAGQPIGTSPLLSLPHWFGGKLFKKWLCEAYLIEVQGNLEAQNNKPELIALAQADELADNPGEENEVAKPQYISPTYVGSDKWYSERCKDAIALQLEHGHPTYFITMTMDPNAAEVVALLEPGQTPNDRPDLLARAFKLRLEELERDLLDRGIFGKCVTYVRTVEYQKRGLPHCHLLLTVAEADRPTPDTIDKLVCAEVPGPDSDPVYAQSVCENLIHGPCGPDHPSCPCMEQGSCRFSYPKAFRSSSTKDEGQWKYRRRTEADGGCTHTSEVKRTGSASHTRTVTNEWVVPHNKYLTKKYGGHINVEACSSMRSVSYVFKYIYKGSDMVMMTLRRDLLQRYPANPAKREHVLESAKVNEIYRHKVARWINPVEAAYITIGGDIQRMYPSALKLAISLPGKYLVARRWAATDAVSTRSKAKQHDRAHRTQLTEFFSMNATGAGTGQPADPDTKKRAGKLLYSEFPGYFRWDASKKTWAPRKQTEGELIGHPTGRMSTQVGRMDLLTSRDPELRALRLLLLNVRGPRSFEDLRTTHSGGVNTVHASFTDTAMARGLMHDPKVIKLGLDEVYHSAGSTPAFRTALVQALQWTQPADPNELLQSYLRHLAEGPLHALHKHLRLDPLQSPSADHLAWSTAKGLQLLHDGIVEAGTVVTAAGFLLGLRVDDVDKQHVQQYDAAMNRTAVLIGDGGMLSAAARDGLHADVAAGETQLRTNPEQWDAYSNCMTAVKAALASDGTPPTPSFLYASGGAGKTFTLNLILKHCRALGGLAVATASTGIAASLLDGGRTFHSTFRPPNPVFTDSFLNATPRSKLGELLLRAHLIVIDEATMLDRKLLEALDRTLQLFRASHQPFGGCAIILAGDWRQCLPVSEGASPAQIINSCIISSPLWALFRVDKLAKNMRLLRDPHLSEADRARRLQYHEDILAIGDDVATKTENGEVSVPATTVSLPTLHESVCGDLSAGNHPVDFWVHRCILTPLNADVTAINDSLLDQLPGDTREYFSEDVHLPTVNDRDKLYGTEYLNQLQPSGLPEHKLRLKVGTPVMLLRNLNLALDQCNGSRYVVREMRPNSILLENMSTQKTMWLFRVGLVPQDRRSTPIQFKRTQFPIRPCMAMTINKSQGQSFRHVGTYLPSPVFAHGQLYVALSRSSNPANVYVCIGAPNPGETCKTTTANMVYSAVLHTARASEPFPGCTTDLPTTNDPESPMTTDHGSDYDELQAAFEPMFDPALMELDSLFHDDDAEPAPSLEPHFQ